MKKFLLLLFCIIFQITITEVFAQNEDPAYYGNELDDVTSVWWRIIPCLSEGTVTVLASNRGSVFLIDSRRDGEITFGTNSTTLGGVNVTVKTKAFLYWGGNPNVYETGECIDKGGANGYYYTHQAGTAYRTTFVSSIPSRSVLPEGDTLVFEIEKKSSDSYASVDHIEVELESIEEKTEWLNVTNFFQEDLANGKTRITIPYSGIKQAFSSKYANETDWLGLPCKYRVVQQIVSPQNGDIIWYKSNFNSFKFIPKLSVKPAAGYPKSPSCVDEDDAELTFKVFKMPPASSGVNFLAIINKYPDDPKKIGYSNAEPRTLNLTSQDSTIPITNLTKGWYVIIIDCLYGDQTLYPYQSDPIFIDDPPAFKASIDYKNKSLGGFHMKSCDATGSLSYNLTNGTPNYSIYKNDVLIRSDFPASGDIDGLETGKVLKIKISDANGCPATITSNDTFAFKKPVVELDVSGSLPSCSSATPKEDKSGTNDGYITDLSKISANYTSCPLTCKNSLNQSVGFSGLVNETYTVTLSEPGCPVQSIVVPLLRSEVTASLSISQKINCTGSQGLLKATGGGGTESGYMFSWDNKINWTSYDTINRYVGTNYSVYAKDNNGCVSALSNPQTLDEPVLALQLSISKTDEKCGQSNGSVNIIITGGEKNYQLKITGPNTNISQTTENFSTSGLKAGTYTVTVTDKRGCVKTDNFIIDNKSLGVTAKYNFTSDVYHMRSCDLTGTLNLTITNGTAPYKVLNATTGKEITTISTEPSGSINLSGFPLGPLTLKLTDKNNCEAIVKDISGSSDFLSDFVKPSLSVTNIVGTPPGCSTSSDGSISYTLNKSGSYSNYTLLVKDSEGNNKSFTGLSNGTYSLILNEPGCSDISSSVPLNRTPVLVSLAVTKEIACLGEQAELTITAGGGTGSGYQYSWDNKNTWTSDKTRVKDPGTFQVYAKDANSCISTISNQVEVNQPASLLSISATPTKEESCIQSDGAVSISISGGEPLNGNYSLNISGPSVVSTQTGTTYLNDTLVAGSYLATVTDHRGCSKTSSFTIGSTSFSATTKYNFTSDNYHMRSCDTNGTLDLTFSKGTAPYKVKKSDDPSWEMSISDSSSVTMSGFPVGQYTLTVTDKNGCIANNTGSGGTVFNVNFNKPSLDITKTSSVSPDCNAANEGVNNNGKITYTLTKSDNYNNYSIKLNETGELSTNNSPFTGREAGNYTISLLEPGCSGKSYPVIIDAPAEIVVTTLADSISCKGETTRLVVSPNNSNYSYSLDKISWWANMNSNSNFFDVNAGIYTAYVKNSKGCIGASNPRKITEADQPLQLSLASKSNSSCDGAKNGSVTISITGGLAPYELVLKKGSAVIESTSVAGNTFTNDTLVPGDYSITVTDKYGCNPSLNFTMEPEIFTISNVNPLSTQCISKSTGQILFDAEKGNSDYTFYLYKKSGSNYSDSVSTKNSTDSHGDFGNLAVGLYQVRAQDGKGCSAVKSDIPVGTIEIPMTLSATVDVQPFCNGSATGSLIVSRTNGNTSGDAVFDYSIQRDGNTFRTSHYGSSSFTETGLPNGSYTIEVTDDIGCTAGTSVNVSVNPVQLELNDPEAVSAACASSPTGKISVTPKTIPSGLNEITYVLNNGKTSTDGVFTGLTPGNSYTVHALYGQICTTPESNYITVDVSNTNPITLSVNKLADQSCPAVANGRFTVSAVSHYGSETYTITKIVDVTSKDTVKSDFATFGNRVAKTYTIAAMDDKQCRNQATITLSNLNNVPHPGALADATGCEIAANGTIHFNVKQNYLHSPYRYYRLTATADSITTADGSFIYKGLVHGDYTLRVKDSEGCYTDSTVHVAVTSDSLKLVLTKITNPSCPDAATGRIVVNRTNGNPYKKGFYFEVFDTVSKLNVYSSYLTGSSVTLGNFSKGAYKVKVSDSVNCTFNNNFTLADPLSIKIDSVITRVRAKGAAQGAIAVALSGGNHKYEYQWVKIIQDPNTITNLQTGVTALVPESAQAKVGIINQYAGNYRLMVRDTAHCTFEGTSDWITRKFIIPEPDSALDLKVTILPVSCDNRADGVLTFNGLGGWGNYKYSADSANWNTKTQWKNLLSRTYKIFVKDQDSVVFSKNIILPQMPLLTVDSVKVTDARCHGSEDGSMQLYTSGGTSPYVVALAPDTLLWRPGTTYSGLPVGASADYKVVVKDSRNCVTSVTRRVNQPERMSVVDSVTLSTCQKYFGAIKLKEVSGGTPGYVYTWKYTDAPENPTIPGTTGISDLKAGNYRLILQDSHACKDSFDIFVSDNTDLRIDSVFIQPAFCQYDTAGKASISVSFGTQPYQITWPDGSHNTLTKGLKAGTHQVVVKDARECMVNKLFTVPHLNNLPHPVAASFDPAGCTVALNAAIHFQVTQKIDKQPYRYFEIRGLDTLLAGTSDPSFIYKGIGGGTHRIRVSDVMGCYTDTLIKVPFTSTPLDLQLSSTVNPSCPSTQNGKGIVGRNYGIPFQKGFLFEVTDSVLQAKVSSVYSAGSVVSLDGLGEGVFHVSVTDSVGCSASDRFSLVYPKPIQISEVIKRVRAKGMPQGAIVSSISGGNGKYEYKWERLNLPLSGNATLYTGTTLPGQPSIPSPLYLTDQYAGTYRLSVRDTAHCIFEGATDWITRNYSIPEPDSALGLKVSVLPVSCGNRSDGNINYQGLGGWGNYTYSTDSLLWDNRLSLGNIPAGIYKIFVKDQDSVVFGKNVNLDRMPDLTVDSIKVADANCNGSSDGAMQFYIKGGTSPYSLAQGTDTTHWLEGTYYSGLASNNYTMWVKDFRNCRVSTTKRVGEPGPIRVTDTTILDSRCLRNNGAISAVIQGGTPAYTYFWYSSDTSFVSEGANNLFAGTYHLDVMDAHLCKNSFFFTVPDISDLTIDKITTSPVNCYGDRNGEAAIVVSKGNPPYTISWPDGSQNTTITGLRAGKNYKVLVSDKLGCHTSMLFDIGSPSLISLESHTVAQPLCLGVDDGQVSVLAKGGTPPYSYSWSNGKTGNINRKLSQGNYSVSIRDDHNCLQDFNFTLAYERFIKPDLGPDLNLCYGNDYSLIPASFAVYDWKSPDGASSADPYLIISKPGTYTLEVKDQDGCIGRDTMNLKVSENKLSAEFLMASEIPAGDTLIIIETSWPLPDSIRFVLPSKATVIASGEYFRQAIIADTGTYKVTLYSHLNDCFDMMTKTVTVVPRTEKSRLKSAGTNLIRKYLVYPNPNTGSFSADIELNRTSDITMRLISLSSGVTYDVRTMKGSDLYTARYSLPDLPVGSYVLYLQAGKESRTISIIKQ